MLDTPLGRVRCGTQEVPRQFSHFPIDPERVREIEPMGRMAGSHVTPTSHMYLYHDEWGDENPDIDVVSPADARLIHLGRMPGSFEREDYFVTLAHSCTLFTIYIHAGALAPRIAREVGILQPGENWHGDIPLQAGDLVTKASKWTLDFLVADTTTMLPGFVVPEHYQGEAWKVHVVDPFDFYSEPLRGILLSKNPRTAEPRGGKIDYDIDGRLVGNWFLEGTQDYSGGTKGQGGEYWIGHLTFAYDYIDPDEIRISIGADVGIPSEACRVCAGVYSVRGNSPDPADISVESGLVKLELVARVKEPDSPITYNLEDEVLAILLVQMIADRTIRFEVFPGATLSQVDDFTEKAVEYHR